MLDLQWTRNFSLGTIVIALLAALSSLTVLLWKPSQRDGLDMWLFSLEHEALYRTVVADRDTAGQTHVRLRVLSMPALERRMLSGFFGGLPTADLLEVERQIAGRAFTGPIENVGFVDLTDRLRTTGLIDQINPPSFSPWTNRGRIFGLPHDVHPVMLGYRADIVEAAGLDVSQIETWDDFARVLRPLMTDDDADGHPDRYLMGLWESDADRLDTLLLQAGGRYFDDAGACVMDDEVNVRALATMVSWFTGPAPFATDVPDFSAGGNKLKEDGYAIAFLVPDWMCNIWRMQMPGLAGKVKLMPLPAFEPGGRRTSVWGGTMLGIPKTARSFEESWDVAVDFYFSEKLAKELYSRNDIITPVRSHWDDPIFDAPDPFFSGQAKGRMYIELAPQVPLRTSSPYYKLARDSFRDAAAAVAEWARATGAAGPDGLLDRCRQELARARAVVNRQMGRNVFLEVNQ
ncbi:MAG: extracellular solute-binding protein [Leptolyngbya sp. PLA3]|nr:MAG: extracellular solute-binding protein [Cyanobacteria bacterium CYA]MCE7967812.1 extracellular solute-binding protein [Leptolyngbya sp. PL-A3]